MFSEEQKTRLEKEKSVLDELESASTIFSVEASGDPPNRYQLNFKGRGVCRSSSVDVDVEYIDQHECEIRLPAQYPEQPPSIRWLTPIYHPNISFSGFINLEDLGLEWEESIELDVICERLWDLIRMAKYDLENATNHSAQIWFEKDSAYRLPLDQRPLRDRRRPSTTNIIKYDRRGRAKPRLSTQDEVIEAELFYIGDETVPPASEVSVDPLPPVRPARSDSDAGDEIFFIGDD